MRLRRALLSCWLPLCILGAWQILASLRAINLLFFPAPSTILSAAWSMVRSGELGVQAGATCARLFVGSAIGIVSGLACGLAMGAFDRLQFNQRSENGQDGTYTFSSLVEFLQGRARSGDLMMPGSDTIRGWRQSFFSGFVQDEYRVNSRLNITFGVRYEAYSTPTEVNGKIATLRDPLHDSAVTVGGPLFENPSKSNFAPRVSLAFDPIGKGKIVIRAGAGVFYDLISARELVVTGVRMPPFFNQVSLSQPAFPNLLDAARNASPVNSMDLLDYRISQPYVMQFQLMMQQELARGMVLHLGYVGTRGVHLPGLLEETNPIRPQVLSDGELVFPDNGVRLNPAFSRIRSRSTQFNSIYLCPSGE
jgi:hypothetical protein